MSYKREEADKKDFRTNTMSFKVTDKEEKLIRDEVKRRKMRYISEYLALCVFDKIGEKL